MFKDSLIWPCFLEFSIYSNRAKVKLKLDGKQSYLASIRIFREHRRRSMNDFCSKLPFEAEARAPPIEAEFTFGEERGADNFVASCLTIHSAKDVSCEEVTPPCSRISSKDFPS